MDNDAMLLYCLETSNGEIGLLLSVQTYLCGAVMPHGSRATLAVILQTQRLVSISAHICKHNHQGKAFVTMQDNK